jgi:hypothetical protein
LHFKRASIKTKRSRARIKVFVLGRNLRIFGRKIIWGVFMTMENVSVSGSTAFNTIVKALGKSKESYPTRRVLAKLLIDHPVVPSTPLFVLPCNFNPLAVSSERFHKSIIPFLFNQVLKKRSPKKQLMMEK